MTTYLIFESFPWRSYTRHDPIPHPSNPVWTVAVYERVGETPQRLIVKHAGGEFYSGTSRDGQGRAYIEKAEHRRGIGGRIWETTDLASALAYRERVKTAWGEACAARDGVASPLFSEIAALQVRIKDADAVCDARLPSIRAACPRPVAEGS